MANAGSLPDRSTSSARPTPPQHSRTKSYTHVFPAPSPAATSNRKPPTTVTAKAGMNTTKPSPRTHTLAVSASNSNMFFNGLEWLLESTAELKKPVSLEGTPLTKDALRILDKESPASSGVESRSDKINMTSSGGTSAQR
ncbi:hypothetical protein M409DRAFT_54100 [Zasmidium cellare ATCC 36951]|uniref:Uncharacterized protein n=1 Tax=Zasmidium cellare ATCC 36951 TaxID=1080233 RepID=A0A6A6CKD5_ZASCE|nr:uncharacterized protein M409DRAFT_54100 [Zasmidium cellare ATCC 36951]KAF2167501.1 hypothetical protein M409DRAFT_54100 [Zasmidium cellare ATCC 36951]